MLLVILHSARLLASRFLTAPRASQRPQKCPATRHLHPATGRLQAGQASAFRRKSLWFCSFRWFRPRHEDCHILLRKIASPASKQRPSRRLPWKRL